MTIGALRQLEVFRAVAERSQSLVVVTGASQRIEWVNELFTQSTGYSAAEVIGRTPDELLVGPDSSAEAIAELARARAEGRPASVEILHYRKSGEQYWALVEGEPTRDPQGR